MNILVAAGGTLGHISPAIVYINELKIQYEKVNVFFVATTKDEKYEIFNNENISKVYFIKAYGMSKSVKKWLVNFRCYLKIKNLIKQFDIKMVFGFGGYISGISLLAGKKCKCRTYIHEQNSVMGKANRYIAKYVDQVFLTYPLIKNSLTNFKVVGSPVYLKAARQKEKIYKEKNTILFTSGSLGARVINDLAVEFVKSKEGTRYQVIIVTGNAYYSDIKKKLMNYHNVTLYSFTNDLISLISKSEIVITRAGASTLFEIMGTNTVPIIIPSVNVTENHQYFNAIYFTNMKCGRLIEEKDLDLNRFLNELKEVKKNYQKYQTNITNLNLKSSSDEMIKESMNE